MPEHYQQRTIKSFSLVCTSPCHKEAALLIYSIRRFYTEPILLICDSVTQDYLKRFTFKDVIYRVEANPDQIKEAEQSITVKKQNTFHSVGAIYKKMDVIDWATNDCGNTMFLDADIVLLNDIQITHPVMLSPHYHVPSRAGETWKYGGFNAGYVFNETPGLAKAWRNIYLHRSSFYEQQGMSLLFEEYDVGKFDRFHNIGFWRNTKPQEPELLFDDGLVRSIHCHFDKAAYSRANEGLTKAYDNWQQYWRERVPDYITTFLKDIEL